MDGGTCESSAYCMLGYEATGLCVALGNYHNVDAKRKRLGPEYVDLQDLDGVVLWFVELARTPRATPGAMSRCISVSSRWRRLTPICCMEPARCRRERPRTGGSRSE